jgi:hypothetical protein
MWLPISDAVFQKTGSQIRLATPFETPFPQADSITTRSSSAPFGLLGASLWEKNGMQI